MPIRTSFAILLLAFATEAGAGPPVSLPTVPGISRGMPGIDDVSRSGGLINAWKFRNDWTPVGQSYASALQFAGCASGNGGDALLEAPIGAAGEVTEMRRFVQRHRACVGEIGQVSPLLLRAALAEQRLLRSQRGVEGAAPIGVPSEVDGYPLARLARCQQASAPLLVDDLLTVAPGSAEERARAEALFAATSVCGASRLGRLDPTVARIALVEARWVEQIGTGR